jgi:hypothetical protein
MEQPSTPETPIGTATSTPTPTIPAAKPPATDVVKTVPGHVQGTVEYREGDGPMMVIRPGPVHVQTTGIDATLGWEDGETRGSAAMPIAIFRNYVAQGAIKLDA